MSHTLPLLELSISRQPQKRKDRGYGISAVHGYTILFFDSNIF